jgi:hypothetical protein
MIDIPLGNVMVNSVTERLGSARLGNCHPSKTRVTLQPIQLGLTQLSSPVGELLILDHLPFTEIHAG